jgi:hypothetical protein
MKITKENAVAQVTSSVSSIFTKEDVLFLINSIEVKKGISPQDIERVVDNIMNSLEMNCDDIVDRDSAEFEISYNNTIELTGVPIQFDYIRESIENNLCEFEVEEEVEQEVSSSEFTPVDEN